MLDGDFARFVPIAMMISQGFDDFSTPQPQVLAIFSCVLRTALSGQIFLQRNGHGNPPTLAMVGRAPWGTHMTYLARGGGDHA